jgi:hypothetical protein
MAEGGPTEVDNVQIEASKFGVPGVPITGPLNVSEALTIKGDRLPEDFDPSNPEGPTARQEQAVY